MSLTAGHVVAHYRIAAVIGAGGMGEVYRATDTKLGREVALKALPVELAQDPERLGRFEREAHLLASLNHPNIAHVYGFESAPVGDGATGHFLAMELVEGEDLAERLKRGAIPVEEAIAIARQIAEALEEAHEKGIVHRDLKPANVKVTPEGRVKVLDFGLAKAYGGDAASGSTPDLSHSPTVTRAATHAGVILGTPAYMSPEQARGRPVDKRTDIWAFGAVLYEMLTGRRLFGGETVSDVVAAILTREPDWSRLPPALPADLRWLLARCLERDSKARLRDIGEARLALGQAARGGPGAAAPDDERTRPATWSVIVPWTLAAVLAAVAAALYIRAPSRPTTARPVLRVELLLPEDVEFFGGPSTSADASRVAFVGVGGGVRQMYLRALEEGEFRPVPGTDAAVNVALSPDGRKAAFVANDTKLKLADFTSGVVESLANGASIYSAPAWLADGSLVFSRGDRLVVRSSRGEERDVAMADPAAGEGLFTWPVPIEEDRAILFVSRRRTSDGMRNRLEYVALSGGARHAVLDGVSQVVFASADRIVLERDGALFAGRLGPSGTLLGGLSRLAMSASVSPLGGVAATVSASGAFTTAPRSILDGYLVWVSRDGISRPAARRERGYLNPRSSPDGLLIAFSEIGGVWTLDPARDTFNRVSGAADATFGFPMWSRDGRSLYFRSPDGIRLQRADGEGGPKMLPGTNVADYPGSLSADGSTLYFLRLSAPTGGDIYTTPAEGGEVRPFLVTNAYEGGPQVSPDGRWLLYVSNESGRMQVYVRPLEGSDRKWPVSSEDSIQPLWSRDGREVFYRSGPRMLAVEVTTTPELRMGAPRVLFEKRHAYGQNLTIPNYSLSPDGREFLMIESSGRGRHLNVVLHWLDGLE